MQSEQQRAAWENVHLDNRADCKAQSDNGIQYLYHNYLNISLTDPVPYKGSQIYAKLKLRT